jgi:hypothetical protein
MRPDKVMGAGVSPSFLACRGAPRNVVSATDAQVSRSAALTERVDGWCEDRCGATMRMRAPDTSVLKLIGRARPWTHIDVQ